jgi:hypothetical protein
VARVLEEKEFNTVRPEKIVSLVHDSGALDRTRSLAHEYARRAKACLNGHVLVNGARANGAAANGAAANGGKHASSAKVGGGSDSEYARALATLPDFVLEREN